MRPAQALDVHGMLLEVLQTSPAARELVDIVAHKSGTVEHRDGKTEPADRDMVGRAVLNHLRVAETFHIDEAVTRLVRGRTESLSGTSQFREYPPPTEAGLLVLDEPFRWDEAGGRREAMHMVSWGPAQFTRPSTPHKPEHGTLIVFWNDHSRDPDEVAADIFGDQGVAGFEQARRWCGGLFPCYILTETADMRIGPWQVMVPEERRTQLIDEGFSSPNELVDNPLRYICAVWQLLDETITVVEQDYKIERHFRKRAQRRKIKPRVTVVTLRRTSEKGLEGARGPLEERHRVRRHRRRYWVGSGADRHLEVRYIEQHFSPKNPNLPLAAETQKVYDLKR